MAKKSAKRRESNQALIICLVFSVLLNIALAVATFAGYSDQAAQDAKVKAAQKLEAAAKANREWELFNRMKLKAALGFPLTKEEEDGFALNQKKYVAGELGKGQAGKDDVDKLLKKIDDELLFDPAKNQYKTTYLGILKKTRDELAAEQKKFNEMNVNNTQAINQAALRNKTATDELAKWRQQLEEIQKKRVDDKQDKSKEFDELKNAVTKWLKDREDFENKAAAEKQELQAKIVELEKKNKELFEKYQKTLIKVAPIDLIVHDEPKGKILRLDRTGGIAYVDLGFSDNVKPQLTFSVYPAGSDKAKGERKASIEIINVLAAHLSAARIQEITDPSRDPVLVNDTLFNPAWSPTLKQHVAIAGLVDLTGDGNDDTEEFMRNLEKQNIVIDSYIDVKDKEFPIKGEMTFKTNYLILGEVPTIDRQLPDSDPRLEQKTRILTKLSEMQNQAGKLGVTVVPVRRFMTLIGYKLPKSIRPAEYNLRSGMAVTSKDKGDGDGEDKPAKPKPKAKGDDDGDEKMDKMDKKPKAKAKAKDDDAMEKDDKEKAKDDDKKDKAKKKADDDK